MIPYCVFASRGTGLLSLLKIIAESQRLPIMATLTLGWVGNTGRTFTEPAVLNEETSAPSKQFNRQPSGIYDIANADVDHMNDLYTFLG